MQSGQSMPQPSIRFDVVRPDRYDPAHLVVRIILMMLLAVVGAPLGWVFFVLYLALPALAAIVINSRGASYYQQQIAPHIVKGLRWLLELYAYLGLLTDRLPLDESQPAVRYEIDAAGAPTAKSALVHLLTSIPVAILLWALGLVSAVLWLIAAVFVLLERSYPSSVFDFQRGILRVFARFLAHHASLVEGAPPLRFDTGPEPAPGGTADPMPPSAVV